MSIDLAGIIRRVLGMEDSLRELRADLGDIPVRRPPAKNFRLGIDHVDHEASTAVREVGIVRPGLLHHVWKVLESPGASRFVTATSRPENKLAFNCRMDGEGHSGGWVWADMLPLDGVPLTRRDLKGGYGRWGQLIGVEDNGGNEEAGPANTLNLRCIARWNNENGSVGPIFFAEEPLAEYIEPPYLLGPMVMKDGYWWCASNSPDEYHVKILPTPYYTPPVDDPDTCRSLSPPPRIYQKLHRRKVWTLRLPNSTLTNIAQHVACNREDLNFIFRLLDWLDATLGNKIGLHDNYLDTILSGTAGSGTGLLAAYLTAIKVYLDCVHATIAVLQTACSGQKQALDNSFAYLDANGWYTPICPTTDDERYGEPEMEFCPHLINP